MKSAGPAPETGLDSLVANKVPTMKGKSCLAPMLGKRGGIAGDFTVTCLNEDHYWMIGSGAAERYHRRYFAAVPLPAGTHLQSLTESYTGFNVAGPDARQLLQRLSNDDFSNSGFPFMHSRFLTIAGIDVLAMRVSFTGDLGWELYTPEAKQESLFNALVTAGRDFGMTLVGGRSLLSLRVEKGYGSWGREYSPEYWPHEVGLDRLIKAEKPEFLGRDAWLALKDTPPREKLVNLRIDNAAADAWGGEPIFTVAGDPVGRISSGAFSHSTNASVALGFIDASREKPARGRRCDTGYTTSCTGTNGAHLRSDGHTTASVSAYFRHRRGVSNLNRRVPANRFYGSLHPYRRPQTIPAPT